MRPIRLLTALPRISSSHRIPRIPPPRAPPVPARRLHLSPPARKEYDFAGIRELCSARSPDRILVDVREPGEYRAGAIPNAVNIPIVTAPDAFALSDEDFEDRFGFAKPRKDQEVVFYCKAGIRSRAAASVARGEGYEKVGEYPGSWVDWEKNTEK